MFFVRLFAEGHRRRRSGGLFVPLRSTDKRAMVKKVFDDRLEHCLAKKIKEIRRGCSLFAYCE